MVWVKGHLFISGYQLVMETTLHVCSLVHVESSVCFKYRKLYNAVHDGVVLL